MHCPKCQALMVAETFEGVTVDQCTVCKGIWFDAGEQRKLARVKGSEKIDSGEAGVGRQMNQYKALNCPQCKGPLARMADEEQPHVVLEMCIVCRGIFLDAGEFTDLKQVTVGEYVRGLFRKKKPGRRKRRP